MWLGKQVVSLKTEKKLNKDHDWDLIRPDDTWKTIFSVEVSLFSSVLFHNSLKHAEFYFVLIFNFLHFFHFSSFPAGFPLHC